MEIGSPAWRRIIQDGGVKWGLSVDDAAVDRLARHATELLRWNAVTNLTAITDPVEIAVKHVLDSMAPLPLISETGSLLDVGSGGGFPGIVIKIFRPDLTVTLIDASRKKISFLSHVIRSLGLKRTEARHIRAETLATEPPYRGHFDVIVCRALCSLSAFVPMASPLLAPGGLLLALKGKREETEVERRALLTDRAERSPQGSTPDAGELETAVNSYRLSDWDDERSLVTIRISRPPGPV